MATIAIGTLQHMSHLSSSEKATEDDITLFKDVLRRAIRERETELAAALNMPNHFISRQHTVRYAHKCASQIRLLAISWGYTAQSETENPEIEVYRSKIKYTEKSTDVADRWECLHCNSVLYRKDYTEIGGFLHHKEGCPNTGTQPILFEP